MNGPVTRKKQTRFLFGLFCVFLISVAVLTFSTSAFWKAFGSGLGFPGAGFLLSVFDDGGLRCFGLPAWMGHLAAFLVTLAIFGASIVFWFGAGNIILPPFIWVASAYISAWLSPTAYLDLGPIQTFSGPILLIGFALLPICKRSVNSPMSPPPAFTSPKENPHEPLTDETLALTRFALDRALQPVEKFDGFQFVDQFQTAATRYQIAQTGYALSLLNARLPAFRGYLRSAQENLILKQTDPRIWRYWQFENAWGNFDLNSDPIARDNIMYTGFLAAQIAMFQAATGDMQFSTEHALILDNGKRRFTYDHPSLINALYRGWNQSEFTLMPCEPNWIYPLCNAIGASAAIAHDRKNGTSAWAEIQGSFRASIDHEFTAADGRILPFRSSRAGIPSPHVGGAVAEAYPSLWWNTSFPDIAQQQWAIARHKSIEGGQLRLSHFWKIDTGDYRFSRAASLSGFAAAAAEMGDREACELALQMLENECPSTLNGATLMRKQASVFAHMTELIARLNQGNALRHLMLHPLAAHRQLTLETSEYAHLNVSKAEHADGYLQVCLHPVAPWKGDLPVNIGNAQPHAAITWLGDSSGTSTADHAGMAHIPLSPSLATKASITLRIKETP